MERYYFEKQRECLVIFDYHIIRNPQIRSLNKLTSKGLYLILVEANTVKPTAKDYFENRFETSPFNWKKIYFLIRNTTLDTKARMFQYKVLHNIVYANKMLFKFGKVTSPRCCFCKLHDEIIMHLFYEWWIVKELWNQLESITIKYSYFLDMYTTECHLWISGLRYEWTPCFKPLATNFQNVYL